jgi:histidine decarboxylase
MISRRRFLEFTGLGTIAFSGGMRSPVFQDAAAAPDVIDERLQRFARIKGQKNRLLGYPVNMNTPADEFFQWRRQLCEAGINQFAFNNVGNPFRKSPIPYATHDFERDTIRAFGKLYGFAEDDTWGFLSHSGTDSNMHGMYMGRTLLKERTGVLPMAYFTREAHYSVQILRDLLGMEGVTVGTLADGGMDPDDLARKLVEHANQPALVVATVGTTFKGAIDQLDQIRSRLQGVDSYVHLDAALFGGYLPYTHYASEVAFASDDPAIKSRYDSIAVSCHKFFGFPAPAGLFITTRKLYEEFNEAFSKIHNPEYIHQVPGTITCSRDAVKPAEFYFFTTPSALARQAKDAQAMLSNTSYLMEQLKTRFPQLSPQRSNPMSNTVYFRDPGPRIIDKYSLATMNVGIDGKSTRHAHVIVMPHVSREVLAEFLGDLDSETS